jgi:hypothetical protein
MSNFRRKLSRLFQASKLSRKISLRLPDLVVRKSPFLMARYKCAESTSASPRARFTVIVASRVIDEPPSLSSDTKYQSRCARLVQPAVASQLRSVIKVDMGGHFDRPEWKLAANRLLWGQRGGP